MLHGDEFGRPDWILMLFAPPVAGCAIGLWFSRARGHPGLAVIGASVGGSIGAWLGIALYRWVMNTLIGGRDINIFALITSSGFLLGAIPSGWALAGPKTGVSRPIGCGFALPCSAVAGLGVCLYGAACEPSAFIPIDESVKYLGIGCILGGTGTLVIGLLWTR